VKLQYNNNNNNNKKTHIVYIGILLIRHKIYH
jgi:hypothetical protein